MRSYRIFLLLSAISMGFILLLLQLLRLQTAGMPAVFQDDHELVRRAVSQRRTSVLLDEGRGIILDRNGAPLAGVEVPVLYLSPEAKQIGETQSRRIAAILGISNEDWHDSLEAIALPSLWRAPGEREPHVLDEKQEAAMRQLNELSLRVVTYRRRYALDPIARHLIGFVAYRERWGAAGLERAFDPFLRSRGTTSIAAYQSAGHQPLDGLQLRYIRTNSAYYPLQVRTTISAAVQRQAETVMEKSGIDDGTIVVLDAGSGDILAMASKPDFDPYRVDPERSNWRNRAVVSEIPGSIFKIVVAAAALETKAVRPGERFFCNGTWKDGHLRCWKRGGHGPLTLEEAFASSCNLVFAELGERLGASRLSGFASRLGIGQRAGWGEARLSTPFGEIENFRQIDGEEPGRLFAASEGYKDRSLLALTSIGQHDVRLTALQTAQLTSMVAGNGKGYAPRVATEIRFSNNRTAVNFPKKRLQHPISPKTIRWLKHAMGETVAHGTGRLLAGLPGGAAGKTGTAQTGKQERVHHWFTGYAPLRDPQYVVTVLARNRSSDEPHLGVLAAERMMRYLLTENWSQRID